MKRPKSPKLSIEGLRLMSICPLCSSKNAPTESQVIQTYGDASLVHLSCKKCAQKILVLFRLSAVGVQCIGIVTDLSPADAKRLVTDRVLDIDDVLEVHEALNEERFLMGIRERAHKGA